MRFFFLLLLVTVNWHCYSQISERVINKPQTTIGQYDTLSNFPKKWEYLVGQEIIFLPVADPTRKIEYDCFFLDSACTKVYTRGIVQTKDLIENKKFIVSGYNFTSPYINERNSGALIKLVSENDDIIYFKIPFFIEPNSVSFYYSGQFKGEKERINIPILIVSYIDKIKLNIGKKFVAKKDISRDSFTLSGGASKRTNEHEMVDLSTGKLLSIKQHQLFECVDISLMATHTTFKQPFLIFRDSLKNEFRVSFMNYAGDYDWDRRLWLTNFYTLEEFKEVLDKRLQTMLDDIKKYKDDLQKKQLYLEECIKLFGKVYGPFISQGEVKLGMDTKMCEYAWGKPLNIKRTTTKTVEREQWIYENGSYLYFENKKLVTVQD